MISGVDIEAFKMFAKDRVVAAMNNAFYDTHPENIKDMVLEIKALSSILTNGDIDDIVNEVYAVWLKEQQT